MLDLRGLVATRAGDALRVILVLTRPEPAGEISAPQEHSHAQIGKPCYGDGNRGLNLEMPQKRGEAKAREGGETQDGSGRCKHS